MVGQLSLSLSNLFSFNELCFVVVRNCRDFWNDTQLGKFGALSVKLTFWMQVSGSGLRLISSFLWCQMYRLGTDSETLGPQGPVDFGRRTPIFASFNLDDPTLGDDTESEVLGGSIYDTATFSSLFENFSRQDYPDIEVSIEHNALLRNLSHVDLFS